MAMSFPVWRVHFSGIFKVIGQQFADKGVCGRIRVDRIGTELFPFQEILFQFRPKRVAVTDHRQVVMSSDWFLEVLRIAGSFPHHEKQDKRGDSGVVRTCRTLPS